MIQDLQDKETGRNWTLGSLWMQKKSNLCLMKGAWTAQLKLAIFALVYVPVGATVAHVADPLNDRALSLQKLEVMRTIRRNIHDHRSKPRLKQSVPNRC
jgi:hypothetical protein